VSDPLTASSVPRWFIAILLTVAFAFGVAAPADAVVARHRVALADSLQAIKHTEYDPSWGEVITWYEGRFSLLVKPAPGSKPVRNGIVVFRYRIHGSTTVCHWVITNDGYLRWVCPRRTWRERQAVVRVRLDDTGTGRRSWPSRHAVDFYSSDFDANGVEWHQNGWTERIEKAVGTVTVKDRSGRIVDRFPVTVKPNYRHVNTDDYLPEGSLP
jgi:hypothetical protein